MSTPLYKIDERLIEFATETQAKYVRAINKHKGMRPAARDLGVNYTTVNAAIKGLLRKAAMQGYSPAHDMTHLAPEPFVANGVSTYYNKDGKPTGQWVKLRLDEQKAKEAIEAAIAALLVDTPRLDPQKPVSINAAHLCNVYTLTDCHIGMRAWGKETGADWDLDIAEKALTGAFCQMVRSSPKASTGIVAQLGDWLHFDSLSAVTPASGHVLDADSRFSKVVAVAVRILRRVVDEALRHHERVVVLMAEGNHDTASAVWLRHMFALLYEREPRVSVIDSELPYYVHKHGETLIAWHHGHLKKPDQLPLLFAAQFAKEWGATTRRYCHTGHLHHVYEKEHSGMTVIQHPTIAARDAYAARGGWIADRSVSAITYHSKFGQVGRTTIVPEMLEP